MLGDLIANLDRPDVAAAVLATLDPVGNDRVERREHCGGDIRTIEIGNKIAEHDPPCRIIGALTVRRLL